jgi:hypothetical protein
MRTSELKKGALDWAVAQAAGIIVYPSKQGKNWMSKRWMTADYGEFNHRHGTPWWNPSWNWSQGGLIIQREGLGIWMYQWNEQGEPENGWYAEDKNGDHVRTGTTPLKAAMRCYVASKLGDEVQLPEGLSAHATPPEG